jgi:hypothetical protein
MRKLIAASILISGSLLYGTPALADDQDKDSSTLQEVKQEDGQSSKDKKHQEIEQKYGKKGKLTFSPLIIRPMRESDSLDEDSDDSSDDDDEREESQTARNDDSAKSLSVASAGTAGFIAVNPALKSAGSAGMDGTVVFPERNAPIDISNVKLNRKTPADAFLQAAQFGLSVMAAGALALTAVAASRAIRRK